MKSLLILGAGGFGHMIQETAWLLGYEDVVFLDDAVKDKDVVGKCCDYKSFLEKYDTAVAALGDNNMRLFWTEKLMANRAISVISLAAGAARPRVVRAWRRMLFPIRIPVANSIY